MAAVTQVSSKYNVSGSMRDNFYNISGATGDTLDVGMTSVRMVNVEGSTITGYTVTANTPSTGQSRITFTASGPFTTVDVEVLGN